MHRISTTGAKYWHELKANRRLQMGLLCVLAMALFEGGMRWNDRLQAQRQELQKLQGDLVHLRAQSRNERALRQSLLEFEQVRRQVEKKVWAVPSEAVGQARLKEWANDWLKRCGVSGAVLNLSAARPLGESREVSQETKDQGKQPPQNQKEALREFRASVRYSFTPETLEKVLAEIEGGDAFSSVETLTVNRRERRVELTFRILMRLAAEPDGLPGVAAAGGG